MKDPVFVVAEIGVNWDGNFELAKDMMMKAKETGCNAVKFQAYDEKLVKNHPERIRLMKSTITKENVQIVNDFSKSIGIEWFCTPMYPEAVDILDPFVKRFKIRVADGKSLLVDKTSELLERVFDTGKEIIVSCETSPKQTRYFNNKQIRWLYCVPKYPCKLEELDFSKIKDFDGFSNHCPDIVAPLTGAILGTKIIEIHITSDKTMDFIDNNVSFDYGELKTLMKLIRSSEKIIASL